MKATIIENNARTNGQIIINGWEIDSSDVAIQGSDKQIAFARDLLHQAVAIALNRTGERFGMIKDVHTTQADMAKFLPTAQKFLDQVAGALNGVHVRVIIDHRGDIAAMVKAAK